MYSEQATLNVLNILAVPLLIITLAGITVFIVQLIFFIKIWNACTDIAKIREILEEVHPVIEDEDKPLSAGHRDRK